MHLIILVCGGGDLSSSFRLLFLALTLFCIEIMAYDIFGSWSTNGAGPNAPLDDACAPVKAGSAKSAVQAWTSAKFPASQVSQYR